MKKVVARRQRIVAFASYIRDVKTPNEAPAFFRFNRHTAARQWS